MKFKIFHHHKNNFKLLFAVCALLFALGINPLSGYNPAQAQAPELLMFG